MLATLIATCPLCGLRFAHRSILELHLREDHVSRNHSQGARESTSPGGSAARSHDAPGSQEDESQAP